MKKEQDDIPIEIPISSPGEQAETLIVPDNSIPEGNFDGAKAEAADKARADEIREAIEANAPAATKAPIKYTDLAGAQTPSMIRQTEEEQAKEYLLNNSVFPADRLGHDERFIDLFQEGQYHGVEGEGSKANFDKFEPGKAVEFKSNHYAISYETADLPADVLELFSKPKETTEGQPPSAIPSPHVPEGTRLLKSFRLESPNGQDVIDLEELKGETDVVIIPGDRRQMFSYSGYYRKQNVIIVAGDIRDPQLLTVLLHEFGHQIDTDPLGDRAAVISPEGISVTEAAKILKSERKASDFALLKLEPFMNKKDSEGLFNRNETERYLETCNYTHSSALFMGIATKNSQKSKDFEPKSTESYYVPVAELIGVGDEFIQQLRERPSKEEAYNCINNFCQLLAKDFHIFAEDQASKMGISLESSQTPEADVDKTVQTILGKLDENTREFDIEEAINFVREIQSKLQALNY